VDVVGRDIGSYVRDAQQMVASMVGTPPGYTMTWSGQYEYMLRAQERMQLVIPATLAIVFLLLYFNFRSVAETLIVMLSLPFALVGGIWFLWLLSYNWSVAVAIGFIALAGVAAETGVVMLIFLDLAWRERLADGRRPTLRDLYEAVIEGAVVRVRPKLMTTAAIMAGLLPILWGNGAGASVMKRIAAPMVGGMLSSTVLTLVVIPAIYALWREHQIRIERRTVMDSAQPGIPVPIAGGLAMEPLSLLSGRPGEGGV
jgi:Cu(I)/Ag(I) efflux system membrane protein CusA/SilA